MRQLGILAHSVEGAALCLRIFAQHGSISLGPYLHPDVTLDCIAMGHSMAAWEAGHDDRIREILAESVRRLARAGADFFVCPDNTAHLALRQPGEPLALPGLAINQVVAEQAARDGHRKVGILGTRWTMDSDLYPETLAALGIDALAPEPAERQVVDDIIFAELVEGVITDESRGRYLEIIERLRDRGCDAVALVCTEIPLLVTPEVAPLPTLDSTRLLAAAAFEVAVGDRDLPEWRGGPIG